MVDIQLKWYQFLGWVNQRKSTHVFFDTNCYRILSRKFSYQVPTAVRSLHLQEVKYNFVPHLNYIVAAELFKHLSEDVDSPNYTECKYALDAAMRHIRNSDQYFLHHPDNEIYYFFMANILPGEKYREESFFQILRALAKNNFTDVAIASHKADALAMSNYLDYLKHLWMDATVDSITKHFDPQFQGGWRIHANDDQQRNRLLRKFTKAEHNDEIYKMFAVGIIGYLLNNYRVALNSQLTTTELQFIGERFKPIFSQQLRILKLMCTNGYNLEKKDNDILDYLILISLHQDIIFVSNETRHLNRNLKASGIKNILSWNDYMKIIKLPNFNV